MFSSAALRASAAAGGSHHNSHNNGGHGGYSDYNSYNSYGYGHAGRQDSYSSASLPTYGSSSPMTGDSSQADDKYMKRSKQEKARQERINAFVSYGLVAFVIGILVLCVVHRDTPEKVAMLEAQYRAKHYHNKPKKTLNVNTKKAKDHMHHSMHHQIKVPHPASTMIDSARSDSRESASRKSRTSPSHDSGSFDGKTPSMASKASASSRDIPSHAPRDHRQAFLSHNNHDTWTEDVTKSKHRLTNGAARHYKSNAKAADAVEMLGGHRTDHEEANERKTHHHHRREKTETVHEHTHHSKSQRAKRKREIMQFQLG